MMASAQLVCWGMLVYSWGMATSAHADHSLVHLQRNSVVCWRCMLPVMTSAHVNHSFCFLFGARA